MKERNHDCSSITLNELKSFKFAQELKIITTILIKEIFLFRKEHNGKGKLHETRQQVIVCTRNFFLFLLESYSFIIFAITSSSFASQRLFCLFPKPQKHTKSSLSSFYSTFKLLFIISLERLNVSIKSILLFVLTYLKATRCVHSILWLHL